MALHTWGRTLSLHSHVHCLVTGGGLDKQQQWRACPYIGLGAFYDSNRPKNRRSMFSLWSGFATM